MKSKTALYTLNIRKMTLTNIIKHIMYMIYRYIYFLQDLGVRREVLGMMNLILFFFLIAKLQESLLPLPVV